MSAPNWVRSESYKFMGDEDVSIDRYIDPEFARKENEKLWTKTWQFACREEHIPAVGDYYVYDLAQYSFIVTRVAENDIRAYYNACLHRGTKLRASGTEGCASEFRCPFHGWSWKIDGSIKNVTCEWDFPHVDKEKFALPQAKVKPRGPWPTLNHRPGTELGPMMGAPSGVAGRKPAQGVAWS